MLLKPSAHVSEISFSGGQTYQLSPTDKVLIVGSNNSGKSQTLREILTSVAKGEFERNQVITKLRVDKIGTSKDLKLFLESEGEVMTNGYQFNDWLLPELHIQFWNQGYLLHGLSPGYIKNIAPESRLTICNQQNSISPGQQKKVPQHVLYDDEGLMGKISDLFKKAFGKDIFFNYRGGSKLPIHVGIKPDISAGDRVSDVYVRNIQKLPLLDKQGDGMKSYAGILFEAIVSKTDITLIDEPEAFLHPPQMRRLGETLAQEVDGQLLVATHSSEIMRGFLEGTKGNVRILRISRDGDNNVVTEASAESISSFWKKPEIRYSNALEGVFHEQTIICEDDSDCRLINSVADYLEFESGERWKDTVYVPTGGKHGVPKIANILRSIGVPIKAVFDLDFLSERTLVKNTVEAFGGVWDDIEILWSRVDTAVRGGNPAKSNEEIKEAIIERLNSTDGDQLPKGEIVELMKQNSPWAKVKKYGSAAIPSGDAQKFFTQLQIKLENVGIYIVQVGEMENFCSEIGGHGPKYVTELLSTIPLGDVRLRALREFVAHIHEKD